MQTLNLSFDFWGTLAVSNPLYKEHQIELICKTLGYKKEFVIEEFKKIKKKSSLLEEQGIQPNRIALYYRFFDLMDSVEKLNNLIEQCDELFLKYPPKIILDIKKLSEVHNCYITSNTILVHSNVLSQFISESFWIPKENMVFSDQVNVTKPNLKIWKSHKTNFDYHIGDNIVTDGACENLNIKFLNTHKNEHLFLFENL